MTGFFFFWGGTYTNLSQSCTDLFREYVIAKSSAFNSEFVDASRKNNLSLRGPIRSGREESKQEIDLCHPKDKIILFFKRKVPGQAGPWNITWPSIFWKSYRVV